MGEEGAVVDVWIGPKNAYDAVNKYYACGDLDAVFAVLKQGISLWPKDSILLKMLAAIAKHPNYYRRSMDLVREGLKINKDDPELNAIRLSIISQVRNTQMKSLMLLDYDGYYKLGSNEEIRDYWICMETCWLLILQMSLVQSMQDRLDLIKAQASWGGQVVGQLKKKDVKLRVRQNLNNKVRIGVMGEVAFENNNVGIFTRPLIEYLNTEKIELYCYWLQDHGHNNPTQQYIAAKSDCFKQFVNHERDEDVAQSIADDGLDALIEIGSFFYRPGVIAHKPAQVIINWLDPPNSSGLPVDYIVVDGYTKPNDENLLLEKPLVVANTWVAIDGDRIKQAPISTSIPQDRNGYITFGAMNMPFKITIEVFRSWAEIMQMVPNSKFLYMRPEVCNPMFQSNFCKHMRQFGIATDRLILLYCGASNVCEHYNSIDIVLDTFPRTGGTTTCEALWMGVPVVSLVGPALYERISYSNLNNTALGDLCAFTQQEYKDIAVQLAQDKERRRYLRQNLRQQILNNPLGKPKEFAMDMEDAILRVLNKG